MKKNFIIPLQKLGATYIYKLVLLSILEDKISIVYYRDWMVGLGGFEINRFPQIIQVTREGNWYRFWIDDI